MKRPVELEQDPALVFKCKQFSQLRLFTHEWRVIEHITIKSVRNADVAF
jgi:hypothetical protein